MNLSTQNISHINTITHDGKVLVFGTAADGKIYYSVKRSGFEDTAIQAGVDPFGFEDWKLLRLGESTNDASVTARDQRTLTDTSGNPILRSRYGTSAEVTTSANAPVQLISALGHLFVFRAAPTGKILVSRFVLDGLANELVPKLEVRFRQSGQRFEPSKAATSKLGTNFDSLDYRDMGGKSFFEPSLELSFAGTVGNGWFAPVFVPTIENDRNRWHLFVYDSVKNKVVLYSVGADANGTFDVKDYIFAQKDPTNPDNTIYRSIPGIIRRTLDLQGMTVAGGPTATTYDLQKEQITDVGPQLIRDAMRVMLAVPVKVGGVDPVKTAVLDFALATDGTLSQIAPTPISSILRSDTHEVIPPLTLMDDIKEIVDATPPQAGTIVATERGDDDQLRVRSATAWTTPIDRQSKIKISGTQSYDGHYQVLSVNEEDHSFTVEATFQNNEAGSWEEIPEKQTGLVFENMIVGAEKTGTGRLKVLCAAHKLKVGDEVQIAGTEAYNGIFPITSIDPAQNSFVLDAPFFTGEAANLSLVKHRGLRMDGNDWVETPDLELAPPSPARPMGRTLSAWVRLDPDGGFEQSIIQDACGMMNLAIGSDKKAKLLVRLSNGQTRTVVDTTATPVNTWTHYSGSLEYGTATGGTTRIALCRNGVEVVARSEPQLYPAPVLGPNRAKVMSFDGIDDYIEVPKFANPTKAMTVSVWARSATPTWSDYICLISKRDAFILCPHPNTRTIHFGIWIGGNHTMVEFTPTDIQGWHFYTGTFNGTTAKFYIDGNLVAETNVSGSINLDENGVMCIGRDDIREIDNSLGRYFKGQLADVQLWNVARSQAEIQADMFRKQPTSTSGLVGYWPLDSDARNVLSPNGQVGNGSYWGTPTQVPWGSAHLIGKGFRGEIAEAQIWSTARPAASVKATMHLQLTGKEQGLVANYRLGAIDYESTPPIVADFSAAGRHGVVYGDPYAGARTLKRTTDLGSVVKYSSDHLVAVSQRGVYEETFEFKVDNSATSFDPNDPIGTGQKLFRFRYWGKSSRGSKQIVPFPDGSITQSDFGGPTGDWYTAKCRVVVPDGVSLLRAFELGDLCGTWTAIDIRKHRIRLISDAVTQDHYTDVTTITSLPAQSQTVITKLADLRRVEAKVARWEGQIADLLARIDVVNDRNRYVAEKEALTVKRTDLQTKKSARESELLTLTNYPYNYCHKLKVQHTGKMAEIVPNVGLRQYTDSASEGQLFQITDPGNGVVSLSSIGYPNRFWTAHNENGLALLPGDGLPWQWWTFVDTGDYSFYIQNGNGNVLDVRGAWTHDGAEILHYQRNGGYNQRWFKVKTDRLIPSADTAIKEKRTAIKALADQITEVNSRITWLTAALASTEDLPTLQGQLGSARDSLGTERTGLASKNTAVLTALSKAVPATMPAFPTDPRGLATTGAVLDFAQPVGGLRLSAGCDGNVRLTYFDTAGRMRSTIYDAVADSRNAAFEQWIPEAVRACADVRDSSDKITLTQAVTLPASGWTCEAWVQYPLATKGELSPGGPADGTAYDTNVVATAEARLDAPLVIRKGKRLGLLMDGWFFDSGADLEQTLGAGAHHLAVSTTRGSASFYADGVKIGGCKTVQPALRFNGTPDYIEVPAHPGLTAALTVSVWARCNVPQGTPSPGRNGALVAKQGAFVLFPVQSSTQGFIRFSPNIAGSWREMECPVANIQGWHLYTGTFDGQVVRLYVDGELRKENPIAGNIAATSGTMYFGNDYGGSLFNGDIAEVSVWNTARDFSEVRLDFSRSLRGNESGLVGLWRMQAVDENGTRKVRDLAAKSSNPSSNDLTAKAYDGLIKGAPGDATLTTSRDVSIKVLGNASTGGSPIGRLAEVRLWNLGLSDAEVAANARAVLTGCEPGLVGYWPLDEAMGATAYDRSAGGQANGALSAVDWFGHTVNIGHLGGKVLNLPNRGEAYVSCQTLPLALSSFTIECWIRCSSEIFETADSRIIASMGSAAETNKVLVFRIGGAINQKKLSIDFGWNFFDANQIITDTDWHHVCVTYNYDSQDATKRIRNLYLDGVNVGTQPSVPAFIGSGDLNIGREPSFSTAPRYFQGDIAEFRIWNTARTEGEIRSTMRSRLSGTEATLLAYYPMNEGNDDNKILDKKSGLFQGQSKGTARLLLSTSLPMAGADSLISAEYSTVEMDSNGRKQALMRRFQAYAQGGRVELLPEQRVEELTLQWVGNSQINPTLLGYIEGAPPVPSENLTVEDEYDGAATVTLTQSEETSYSWQRSESTRSAFNLDGFAGVAWSASTSLGLVAETSITTSEGKIGAVFNFESAKSRAQNSTATAISTLTTTDSLTLTGRGEEKALCSAVGKRWVPKNVGYALVLSGMADVFVTKLKRSGRMVSYDIRPVDGVPLDVNTITFMINPAYTLNGTLDGMVGSAAADPTFYPHVPALRAQYGSLYPASYFRLKDAYERKETIERLDKERESFFYNFDGLAVNQIASVMSAVGFASGSPSATADKASADSEGDTQALQDETMKRQEAIEKQNQSLAGRVRAGAAFVDWQIRMADIQTKAGKRNVVNTYVWDGDGGLRTEQQSFASTIEHSISTETSMGGGGGFSAEGMYWGAAASLSLVASASKVDAMSKTLGLSKALELSVDLSGVERKGITDLRDNPLQPGEKVDRYRFMSFYLEGSTDHYFDFFDYVVDPEWLISNDEEARALREARGAKPNKCWRVLHRVTYVERPALKNIGQELRTPKWEQVRSINALNTRIDELKTRLEKLLADISKKLP